MKKKVHEHSEGKRHREIGERRKERTELISRLKGKEKSFLKKKEEQPLREMKNDGS